MQLTPYCCRELGIAVQSAATLSPAVRRFITYARRIIM